MHFPSLIRCLTFVGALCLSISQCTAQSAAPPSSLDGKVFVGYQGWFNCEGDGAKLGWTHWTKDFRKKLGPTNVAVDLWPDVSEYDASELYSTDFKHADGSTAKVFSSANEQTVLRHFRWMQDYNIDGAFVQRFAVNLTHPLLLKNHDKVLAHVRRGAKESQRDFAVMYDLTGMNAELFSVVESDWARLQSESKITEDPGYLHHQGKPLVAVWGVGFNDNRKYSLDQCLGLVKKLKSSGCSVMLGVPSFWRDRSRDAMDDPLLHEIIQSADIVCPWSVGRYQSSVDAKKHANDVWKLDREWCQKYQLEFLPVVFPGFSWKNLHGGALNEIPRRKGDFLWSQIEAAKSIGSRMVYVAMFDEVDEATAIFKCSAPPQVTGDARFVDYEGLPSDFYLKVVEQAGKLLRDEPNVKSPSQLRRLK